MKKHLLILAIALIWLIPRLFAQDKIYSLNLKEYEIEEAIRSALSPHLEKKDFVVKVRLTGIKKLDALAPIQQLSEQSGEALPGFEFESEIAALHTTEVSGNQYWDISKMRIDLVMYKEISRSVDTYIRETVPVVSEFNPARGDIFNFVPILPKSLGIDTAEATDVPYFEQERDYYGLTKNEWIYLLIGALFIVIFLVLIWRLTRLRRNITALEDAIEAGQSFERGLDPAKNLKELEQEQKQRLEQQESIIKQSILAEKNDKLLQDVITKLLGRPDWASHLYLEFGKDKRGVDKLTRFIGALGPSASRKLFAKVMGEDKYLEIEKMAEGVKKSAEQDNDILQEIQKILFAKTLTSPEQTTFDPFSFIKDLSTGQVAFLIKDEPVKIKAIVLSQLKSTASAEILARIAKEERGKVIQQLGKMNDLPLELAEKVAYNLADKAKDVPGDSTVGFDGVDMVVEVISESDARNRTDMINNLRVSDRELSDKVESRLFLFESIPVVPNEILMDVVRRLPPDDVVTALVGCTKQLQEKVIMCFPEKNRRTLVASLKAQTPTLETIREKQKLIIRAMQRLARDNRVDLRKIQAAWAKATTQKPQVKSA